MTARNFAKMALGLLLVSLSLGANAEWLKLPGTTGLDLYVDPETFTTAGRLSRVLAISEYSEPRKLGNREYKSVRTLNEIDCAKKTHRFLQASFHAEKQAGGDVIDVTLLASPFAFVMPGTPNAVLMTAICSAGETEVGAEDSGQQRADPN